MKTTKNQLEHRGYTGTVNYSPSDKVFWGKLDGMRATISYEGHDSSSLETAFREAVEDYLEMCRAEGIAPEKPYKGTFNVRIPTQLHRELAQYAQAEQINLNSAVRLAVEKFLRQQ